MKKISIGSKDRLEKFLKTDGAQETNLPEEDLFVVAIVFVTRSFPVILIS